MCYCCIQGCSTVPIKNCYQQFLQHSRKRDQLTGVLAGVRAGGRAGMLLLPYTSLAPQLNLARSAAAERPALNRVRAGTRGACTAPRDANEGVRRDSAHQETEMRTISLLSTAGTSPATASAPSPAPQALHAAARLPPVALLPPRPSSLSPSLAWPRPRPGPPLPSLYTSTSSPFSRATRWPRVSR